MVPTSANILVGLPLNVGAGIELLSWAVRVAHPNDNIVALHVLVCKHEKKNDTIEKTKMRRAKAFVISMLGEFAALCQSKQVNLEAKVRQSASIGKGLIEEVAFLKANILVVGCSRNRSERKLLDITKYCFKHAPEECALIAIRKKEAHQEPDSEYIHNEGFRKAISIVSNKANHIGNTISPLPKQYSISEAKDNLLKKNAIRGNEHFPTQSIDEKPSPVTVFNGPEGGTHIADEHFSLEDFINTECTVPALKLSESYREHRRSTSNTWKNLSVIKLFFPFLHSPSAGTRKENDKSLTGEKHLHPSWRCFSYDEISRATNNFHPDNIVGRGGYSEVYRGDLDDGQKIAVKRLSKDSADEHKEKEFLTELGIIGHVCHPNTSYLIGCCFENGFHLIFKLAPNGSLASALHGKDCLKLEWPIRYKIVTGVARGLHYLHKSCKRRIIHRDIKASNVLLGQNFEPQISDFGLAKWLPTQWTHHSVIPIEGTFGYLAPEYFMHGIVDEKTDVYSFGVLLLEIITGRRPVDVSKESLLLWAKPLIESGNIIELADPNLEGKFDMDQMHRLVLTASCCIRQSSIWRPSMSKVLQLITDGHDLELTQSWRMLECKAPDEVDDYTTDIDFHFLSGYSSEEDQ